MAYVIPIYLRWRNDHKFQAGPWNNGAKYRWMNPFATFWVALITIAYCLGVIVVSAGTAVAVSMALGLATAPLFRVFLAFTERGNKAKAIALVD